ncbi:hotdog fold domain-containing protein [Williamsia sterculiae]|uniref:Acyl-coenzyme A thioesterase PaaI, contains HGG motif n=1 Tax=Williamsia sterculiae TaxID=1344003 RepID=A0A1N7GR16_9NOCA|nr:hotdog fold domain-containing protein [Williamsia sterculiae]SIS15011.1 Acyl-coenzyme A thioesterase PaaI, contains HGG motif [Williamsia sterculiae]
MAAQNHAPASPTYRVRSRLPDNVIGRTIFSVAMVARVPYFGGILPYVRTMEPGRCVVTAPKWFGVYNHLGTFHAIAACNLAETAMGMLMEATVPTTHRWIPKGMSTQYLAKATTGLTATAVLDDVDFTAITTGVDVVVPVSVTDRDGVEVVHADIRTWVTPTG